MGTAFLIVSIAAAAIGLLIGVSMWANSVNREMYQKDVARAGVPVTDKCNHRGFLVRKREPSFGSTVECTKCGDWSVDDRLSSST